MPKNYRRRFYRANRDKYSVEQTAGTVATNTSGQGGVVVVSPNTIQGMRKVKHLTVNMAHAGGEGQTNSDILYWALVYVPQGTSANTITIDAGGMYEPNQFVMGCGVFDFNAGPLRIHCPISRNLNSGDNISLVVQAADFGAHAYNYVVKYAITLQ